MSMIEHLLIGWSAYFFAQARKFDDEAINGLFAALLNSVENAGDSFIQDVRKTVEGNTYSVICFPYDRAPSFLAAAAKRTDRIHGYMLIVEHGAHVAILKSGLEIPASFKGEWLQKLGSGAVERAVATADAKFESMRLRAMSTSKRALRTKTLEADDLENSMPMASASRYVSQGYRLRRGSDRYTATPTTGRIAQNSDRSGYLDAIKWAIRVMEALTNHTGAVAPFMENFARPVDLGSLPNTTNPVSFAVDVAELSDQLFSDPPLIKLTKKKKANQFIDLTVEQTQAILNALDQEFVVQGARIALEILDAPSGTKLGEIKWGKARLGLSTFSLPQTKDIYVTSAGQQSDGEDQQIPIRMYLDRENLFLILFDDVDVAYLNGEVFRDKAMHDGGATFLSHLIADNCLKTTNSEKGAFRNNQKKFSSSSVFGQLESKIALSDDVLICDDLGDEWADFIGLNTNGTPPTITFYHAKHGNLSLGASSFHISISQAEKNLGRLALPRPALEHKFNAWKQPYQNEKKVTSIARLMRGGSKVDIEGKIDRLRNAPDVVRRVTIVTSSLSRKKVEDAFVEIKAGKRASAHFVQLYWLLTSFFSVCAEVGAVGYVICQP